ncbi:MULTISPECIES: helix-turn-helix domain-containing protein [unclassified Novosphingobium]|uniref:helix-turn-helix domain-containing protein n=1 Tax=unclassified Novosphingobium TaxID=2644732 RepID=UPI0013599B3F|nr:MULTISPECIES: helix-turn-helix domain-containing protein [unclassified Novosphingobium]
MDDRYSPVRALSRGLEVLAELNRCGRATPAQIAKSTGIDRTTTYRLLATLERDGYVGRSPSDDRYVLSPAVRSLSEGFNETDEISGIVARELGILLADVHWPSDFMTFEMGQMIIRETTHRFSPYSIHRAMVGRPRPLLFSAAGRAVLAANPERERNEMLSVAKGTGALSGSQAEIQQMVAYLLNDYEKRGYAWSVGGTESHISAIALPVIRGDRVAGGLNIVFFRSALSIDAAVERFLPIMRERVREIELQLLEGKPANPGFALKS